MSCQQPEILQPPRLTQPASAETLAQARAEAWAVVHYAERLGHRDISDALHHAVARIDTPAHAVRAAIAALDGAREHALACLDACGALADDAIAQ